jgi:hypothetical protein
MADKKSVAQMLRDVVACDKLVHKRNGNWVFMRGYFYHNGMTAEKYEQGVSLALNNASIGHVIVRSDDIWTEFKGGAPVDKQSRFEVEIKLFETIVKENLINAAMQ